MTNLIVLIIGANNATPRLQPDLLAMPEMHTERAQHQFICEGTIAVVAFAPVMTYHHVLRGSVSTVLTATG